MNLLLLFVDELMGFYKSKVMISLWIGLPLVSILFHFLSSSTGSPIPFTVVSAIVVSSLAGTLASVMLAVSIINEKNRHVYELFLIRPLKRRNIIIAKFLSVYVCIAVAAILAIILGMVADYLTTGTLSEAVLSNTFQSLSISLSMMATSCAAGVLIGVVSPSVLVGAILVIYGGNQISALPLLPSILNLTNPTLFTISLGALMSIILLILAISIFDRKQF
ncbi:ABC-2 transporter permease [Candidatus Bathyarchaeota archaeon]|nr:ABC-2 transporter permease [Candidatus Bathyarchaeota archaeon]